MNQEQIDHLLERLWMAEEEGVPVSADETSGENISIENSHADKNTGLQSNLHSIGKYVGHLKDEKLAVTENGYVKLTEYGRERAEELIRRHRLGEFLLAELLGVEIESGQQEICRIEHGLSREVVDKICVFLGHPPYCPHGRSIPPGRCCKRQIKDATPLVTSLADAKVGKNYKISFITPRHHARLDRLAVLGITPGTVIRLHQRYPSYVLKVAETDVAVDKDIASDIFVMPASD